MEALYAAALAWGLNGVFFVSLGVYGMGWATGGPLMLALLLWLGTGPWWRRRLRQTMSHRRWHVPARVRNGVLVVASVALLAGVSKPAFGESYRFAWRMFAEVLQLQVVLYVERAGLWEEAPLYGARYLWRSDQPAYSWTAWVDQRDHLAAYATWIARALPDATAVHVVVTYARQQDGWQEEVFAVRK